MPWSPAFQVYPKDELARTVMSAMEFGAYWYLRLASWNEDGLPADLDDLADIARVDHLVFRQMWEGRLKKNFVFNKRKRRWFDPRLVAEEQRQIDFSNGQKARGKAGAAKRWGLNDLEDSDGIAPLLPGIANDGSPSPSPIPISDIKRLIERVREAFDKKDPRVVELAVWTTMINRHANGAVKPINSTRYFAPEISEIERADTLSSKALDAMLESRRQRAAKIFVVK